MNLRKLMENVWLPLMYRICTKCSFPGSCLNPWYTSAAITSLLWWWVWVRHRLCECVGILWYLFYQILMAWAVVRIIFLQDMICSWAVLLMNPVVATLEIAGNPWEYLQVHLRGVGRGVLVTNAAGVLIFIFNVRVIRVSKESSVALPWWLSLTGITRWLLRVLPLPFSSLGLLSFLFRTNDLHEDPVFRNAYSRCSIVGGDLPFLFFGLWWGWSSRGKKVYILRRWPRWKPCNRTAAWNALDPPPQASTKLKLFSCRKKK